jgi:hypothetical protein
VVVSEETKESALSAAGAGGGGGRSRTQRGKTNKPKQTQLVQQAPHKVLGLVRDPAPRLALEPRLVAQDRLPHGRQRRRLGVLPVVKRQPPAQQLERHDPGRPHVRGRDHGRGEHLGRHEPGRALEAQVGAGEVLRPVKDRQAKVHGLDDRVVAGGQQHEVARLDVAVEDAQGVALGQGAQDRAHERGDLLLSSLVLVLVLWLLLLLLFGQRERGRSLSARAQERKNQIDNNPDRSPRPPPRLPLRPLPLIIVSLTVFSVYARAPIRCTSSPPRQHSITRCASRSSS